MKWYLLMLVLEAIVYLRSKVNRAIVVSSWVVYCLHGLITANHTPVFMRSLGSIVVFIGKHHRLPEEVTHTPQNLIHGKKAEVLVTSLNLAAFLPCPSFLHAN